MNWYQNSHSYRVVHEKTYYLYIYAYKPGYISSWNDRVHADARSQCDMINKIKILTKHGADMIHAVILTK